MKISAVFAGTVRFYRSHIKEGFLCVILQAALRLMVCAPLLFLITKEVPYLALLSIPLYLIIVPVARQNMAEAMQGALDGGRLFSMKLISCENYGRKFLSGLKQVMKMLLWALLFLAATAVALWAYAGQIDAFTLVRVLMNLGGGSFMDGIKLVLVIYAATILPIVLGCAVHSGDRHARALGGMKIVKGHRLGIVGVWIAGLVTLVPFLAAVGYVGADFVSGLVQALGNLGTGSITLPDIGANIYALAAAFVLLFLPLFPFKQMMTAVYMRGIHVKG